MALSGLSLCTYPEIDSRDARALRDVARALVARDIDPRVHRQLERNARRLVMENA
ncbi:integrase arm-type DNA-binding domain-containing protein [Pseudomonas sp. S10E 269]|uniref:integrase arm-type DNA-binding domain-containing protein n=1 Tax=unclassified Pseudomonas TaxID=196821 RepID=UPI00353170A9